MRANLPAWRRALPTAAAALSIALPAVLAAGPARAEPVLPIDIRNATDCDLSVEVAPHEGRVAAPAGQVARLLVETPPRADGSNSVYRLTSHASADGCDIPLARAEQDWILVRDPEGDFFVDPADPAKPDAKSAVGDGTPTFVFAPAGGSADDKKAAGGGSGNGADGKAAGKSDAIHLTLTTE